MVLCLICISSFNRELSTYSILCYVVLWLFNQQFSTVTLKVYLDFEFNAEKQLYHLPVLKIFFEGTLNSATNQFELNQGSQINKWLFRNQWFPLHQFMTRFIYWICTQCVKVCRSRKVWSSRNSFLCNRVYMLFWALDV